MPNPYRKHSRKRTGNRRAQNWRLEIGGTGRCEHCGKDRPPHTVCLHCGFYAGKLVLPKKEKKRKQGSEEPGSGGEEKG